MKNYRLLFFVLFISLVISVSSQDKKMVVSDVTISSGKTALTSGLDTRISFTNGKNGILFIQANADRMMLNIGKKFKNFQLIESVGIFKNVPWTGPMLVFANRIFDATIWNGVSFSTDKQMTNPGFKTTFFFSYGGSGLTFLKTNRIGAAVMWFKTDPMNWFVSYKKTVVTGDKSKIFGEITYNRALDRPMFVLGYSLKLN